jgi:hypothetical protein
MNTAIAAIEEDFNRARPRDMAFRARKGGCKP